MIGRNCGSQLQCSPPISNAYARHTRKVEVTEGIIIEFDPDNQPLGIEIFDASKVIVSVMGRENLAVPVS